MPSADRIAEWLSEVDNIALSSTVATPDAQAGYIRAMGMLMRVRPQGLTGKRISPAREADVLRLVASGAFETAALRLLPREARVMTSTPGPGRHLATVRLEGQHRDSTSSGSTFALALVSALALSIVDHYHELAGSLPTS
ncbi:hypothetical protein [Novosphingobium mangrovi (ex Huang et al. 2023)]|uniref:Uncharacterized protein n=1 Tax=Novosphingobium mangrovi (ex Huang et al. 2023) TaxID=2976432 RepID=A0ABT2I5U8_9SPHN|nr:hypothetical protein [Novosphingobium mangrovi (ex Huang et al. 2023)]MCT2400184.1 hypothetical protein [Novosphingobium mangrovi (ex Huang et al. 2023)]